MESVPTECTLPTAEQPLRLAEFDALFATRLRGVDRPEPGRLRLRLADAPGLRAEVANLTARESACCTFFTFTLTDAGSELLLDVAVPATQVSVLDGMAAAAASAAGIAT
jgi:hypothetical protein